MAERTRRLHWSSWMALKVLWVVFVVQDFLVAVLVDLPGGWHQVAMHALLNLACLLVVLWPVAGLWVCIVALLVATGMDTRGGDYWLLLLVPMMNIPRLSSARALGLVIGLVGYAGVAARRLEQLPDYPSLQLFAARCLVIFAGVLVGLAIRGFKAQLEARNRRIRELEAERVRVRADERRRLARDLHDIVAHQLAVICLQTLGHQGSDAVDELNEAMGRIDRAARAAVDELHQLLAVLGEAQVAGPEVATLNEVADLAEALRSLVETLVQNGFRVRMELPAALSSVGTSTQLTASRAAREAATNIMRHAAPGAAVDIVATVGHDRLDLALTNDLPQGHEAPRLEGHSFGRGLRGLAERVDLAGGSISVGPVEGRWQVACSLPIVRH